MRIKRACEICGKDYWTGNGKAKYCSESCRKEAARRRQAKWREENPEYHKAYRAEHPEAYKQFLEKHPGYERDRWRKIRGSKEYTRKCIVCGKLFTTWRPHKKTCSEDCKNIRKRKRKRKPKTKEQNHIAYIKKKYGSEEAYQEYLAELEKKKEECKLQAYERRLKEKESNRRFGICVVCGEPFETYNPAQKTCSKQCSKRLQYSRKDKRISKSQIVDNDITLEALFKRDSGVCYLCGGKCDWSDKSGKRVGDSYPSIDHVIPVSMGGLHAWNNVKLTHFLCNANKGADSPPEDIIIDFEGAYALKKEPKSQKKKTLQFLKDGTLVGEYESTAEAERITGIKQRGIQNCARGEKKTCHGFIWKYA